MAEPLGRGLAGGVEPGPVYPMTGTSGALMLSATF